MKVTMSKVLDLKRIYDKISPQTLPIKLTYKLTKFFTPVQEEYDFYQKELAKLLETYSVKDENGRPKPTEDGTGVQIKEDCLEVVQEKLNELIQLEIELSDTKFAIDELESITLSVEEFNVLLPFIQD